jgi:hypothetical protein
VETRGERQRRLGDLVGPNRGPCLRRWRLRDAPAQAAALGRCLRLPLRPPTSVETTSRRHQLPRPAYRTRPRLPRRLRGAGHLRPRRTTAR